MNLVTDFGGALVYFTLLLPVWNERPLTQTDLVPGAYPLAIQASQVDFAQQGFRYADEDLLNTMAVDFGKSQSPLAREYLLRLADDTNTPSVVATTLGQVGNLPLNSPQLNHKLARFFTSDDWRIRFWAVRTYGKLAAPLPAALLQVARNDSSARVKTTALDALAGRTRTLAFTDFSDLMTHGNRRVRQAALVAAMGTSDVTANQGQVVVMLDSPDVSDRYALAKGLAALPSPLAARMGQRLAADEHPSVRAECASQLGKMAGPQAQRILIDFLGDKDYKVRRAAVESLATFPKPDVIMALVRLLDDTSVFVRRQLEETLVKIHPRQAVDGAVVKGCQSQNPDTRLVVYNVLGRVGVQRHGETIVKALASETKPENIAAALNALSRLKFTGSDTAVLPYVTHADASVRQAAAAVLGHLKTQAAATALIQLAADDHNDVVCAAIESMGRMANPVFSEVLLKILKDTSPTGRYSEKHRAHACWAVAKLPTVNNSLRKRLVDQGTKPVIKTLAGKLFEGDVVLVSVIFALAEQTRKNPAVMKDFNKVFASQSRELTKAEMISAGSDVLFPTKEVLDYSAQAKAWVEGRPAKPGLRPKKSRKFLYYPVK